MDNIHQTLTSFLMNYRECEALYYIMLLELIIPIRRFTQIKAFFQKEQ